MSKARDNRQAEALFRDCLAYAKRRKRCTTEALEKRARRMPWGQVIIYSALLYAEEGAEGCRADAEQQNREQGAQYNLACFTHAMMTCGALARELVREFKAYQAA